MTKQYKEGDKVLVEATIDKVGEFFYSIQLNGQDSGYTYTDQIYSKAPLDIDGNVLRPGDECEFWYIPERLTISRFACKLYGDEPYMNEARNIFPFCRKIIKPKTIEIDGVVYDKSEVKERLKELKPIKGEMK